MKTIIDKQNKFIKGSSVEIGVHHGKSLILMAKFSKEDDLYVIDLFNEQKKISAFPEKVT